MIMKSRLFERILLQEGTELTLIDTIVMNISLRERSKYDFHYSDRFNAKFGNSGKSTESAYAGIFGQAALSETYLSTFSSAGSVSNEEISSFKASSKNWKEKYSDALKAKIAEKDYHGEIDRVTEDNIDSKLKDFFVIAHKVYDAVCMRVHDNTFETPMFKLSASSISIPFKSDSDKMDAEQNLNDRDLKHRCIIAMVLSSIAVYADDVSENDLATEAFSTAGDMLRGTGQNYSLKRAAK